jgi:hypothetical protein
VVVVLIMLSLLLPPGVVAGAVWGFEAASGVLVRLPALGVLRELFAPLPLLLPLLLPLGGRLWVELPRPLGLEEDWDGDAWLLLLAGLRERRLGGACACACDEFGA